MTGSGGEEDDCGSVDTEDPESRVGCCDTVETGVAGPTRAASPQVFEMLYAGVKRPLTVEEVEGVEKTEALGAVRALRTEELNQMEISQCQKKPAWRSGCSKRRRKREHQLNKWKKLNQSDEEELQPDAVTLERLLQCASQVQLTKASKKYVTELMTKHKKLFEPRTYDPAAKPHVVDGVEIAFDIEEKEQGIRYYKSPKPMRLGLAGEARVAEAVEALIKKGVMIKARNPRHVSNVFVVPKKNPDGTTKACGQLRSFKPVDMRATRKHTLHIRDLGSLVQGKDFDCSGRIGVVLCACDDGEGAGAVTRPYARRPFHFRKSADGSPGFAGRSERAGERSVGAIYVWPQRYGSELHGRSDSVYERGLAE